MFRFFAHGGKADLKAEADRECPPFAAATVKAAIDILPDGEVFNMTISGSAYDEVPEGTTRVVAACDHYRRVAGVGR